MPKKDGFPPRDVPFCLRDRYILLLGDPFIRREIDQKPLDHAPVALPAYPEIHPRRDISV